MGDNEPILVARDLCREYESGPRVLRVVDNVNLEIAKGDVVSIVGPSGAGKSTLLHLLGALDAPSDGEVIYRGEALSSLSSCRRAEYRNRVFGFVFQFYHLLPDFTALENVHLPALVKSGDSSRRRQSRQHAEELLKAVGLSERLDHRPSQLSGGERQRVAIARALTNSPEILLCDEPTGNLDTKTGKQIIRLLWKLHEDTGVTLVLVTHDENLASKGMRRMRMVDGRVIEH